MRRREDLRAGPLDRGGRRMHLRFALREHGPGDHDHFIAADPQIADRDDGVFGWKVRLASL
jgi:hypothetical protein